MSTLGALVVSLEANTAQFSIAMDKAAHVAEQSMARVEKASEIAKEGLELIGVGLGAMEFIEAIHGAIEMEDHLHNLSLSTRLSVEDLAGLSLAAKSSGSDLDGTAQAVNKLASNMGKNAEKFAALGVTAKDPLKAFGQLADVMNAIDDPQKRAAVGAVALGKGWQSSAALMALGSEKIDEMIKKGTELSGVTQESADKSHEFAERLDDLKARAGGWTVAVANPIIEGILKISDALTKEIHGSDGSIIAWMKKQGGGANIKSGQEIIDAIRKPHEEVKPAPKPKASAIDDFIKTPKIAKIADPWVDFTNGLDKMIDKSQQGEYAMLKLEATQKATGDAVHKAAQVAQADFKIDALQRSDSQKAVDAYVDKLDKETQAYKDEGDLIGKNALDTLLLVDAQKKHADAFAMVEAAKKSGKPLDMAGEIATMQAATDATIANRDAIIANSTALNSWDTGANAAFNDYLDNATSAATQSKSLFTDAFRGMEDALVKFAQTGKTNSKSLANSIIADLIRIQVQNSITKPLAQMTSGMNMSGIGSSIASFASSLFRATGGPVNSGSPYVVGENGPEWFVPGSAGSIAPNGAAPTMPSNSGQQDAQPVNVTFQIKTNDARSFQNALAENKNMIVGIINQALNGRGRPGVS